NISEAQCTRRICQGESVMAAVIAPSIRGPLKFTFENSTPGLEAGEKFSISLPITNPYDVPVTIYQVEAKLPSRFVNLATRKSIRRRALEWLKNVEDQEERRVIAEAAAPNNQGSVLLQPGNSTVQVFRFYARGWLVFSPAAYGLNAEILYTIDGK